MTHSTLSTILDHLHDEARNSVQAAVQVSEIARSLGDDGPLAALAAAVQLSADRLLRGLDDLRDLASPALPAHGAVESFDFAQVAAEIVELLNLASASPAPKIRLEIPREPLLITQDRRAVEQVLMRLLDTTGKLAHNRGVVLSFSSMPGGDGVRMEIAPRDTALAQRLATWLSADPKEALLTATDVPLGLAVLVAGRRLRALGATTRLTEGPAALRVWIDIPTGADDAGSDGLCSGSRLARPDALKILVAEDNDESFALSHFVLQQELVWRARDGVEALRALQKQRFDLVIMDVHMPAMDGYSVIRNIRDWETETGNARTPVVILSSDDIETQRQSAAECGCSGFLSKPLQKVELSTVLDRLKLARSLMIPA